MSAAIGHVNLYNIYGKCITGRQHEGGAPQGKAAHKIPYARDFLGAARARVGGPDACIDSIAGSAYFNQASPPPHPPTHLATRSQHVCVAARSRPSSRRRT